MCILFLLLCYYFIFIGINPFFTELFCQCFRAYSLFHKTYPCQFSVHSYSLFMPPPFEEWWMGIKCYPCPCVHSCVRSFVRASVRPLSKFGVRSITFERLHQFNSNLVRWYIISKHRSSSIWLQSTDFNRVMGLL